ncbi:hypothetical protein BaRGS_00012820, partial [Batillaria attramentaria]
TCTSVVPNPCKQVCHDITGGGFICDCIEGWKLDRDGRDCVVDKSYKPKGSEPVELSNVGYSTRTEGSTDNQSRDKSGNILPVGPQSVQNVQLQGGVLPDPVELGAGAGRDTGGYRLHSVDMKAGLDPPQALYQLQEGGEYAENTQAADDNEWQWNWDPLPDSTKSDAPSQDNSVVQKPSVADGRSLPSGIAKPAECVGVVCENGGTCVLDEGGYSRCNCPFGFTGTYCEQQVEIRFPRFRGTGYLALPVLRDAYKEFAVAVEFRPEAKNGLLLFSAEFEDARKDFFSIALVNGFVEFRFDCGTGTASVRTPVEVNVGQWNQLIVARNDNRGSLQLNGGDIVEGTAPGAYTRITLRQNLYLGGYSNMDAIASRANTTKTFVGCIQEMIVNGYRYDFRKGGLVGDTESGVNVGECSEGLCDGVVCQNGGTCHAKTADSVVCLCPLGFHGEICEKETPVRIPHFNGHSHLEFFGLSRSVLAFTEIEAVIKPEAKNGMILYNGYKRDRKGDFISLALHDGHVEFRFDLGTGPARLRSQLPLTLNRWHVIRASRTGLEGVLKVDDQPEVIGLSQGAYTQLTLLENLFLGGHKNFDHTSKHANLTSSFVGCIQKMVINKRPLAILEEKLDGLNIEPCEDPCVGDPCMNGGECEAQGEVYQCHCPIGRYNTNCEDKMQRLPTKPMFSGSSFLMYTDRDIIKRVAGSKMDLQLHIKPKGPNGLLFWSGQDSYTHLSTDNVVVGDYIGLGFVDGSLQLRFNLGSGEALIGYNDSRLFDGNWHFVRVQRDNQDAYMEVDRREIVEGSAPGSYTMLNTNRVVYLGGMPNVAEGTGRVFTSNYEGCVKDMLLGTDLEVKLLQHAQSGRNILQCRKHL